jgi:hypothetical protein
VPAMDDVGSRIYEQAWPEGDYRHMQIGFLVDDLVEAARQWARVHGIGPFHVLPRWETPYTYRGEPAVLDAQIAVAQAGPVQIELIHQYDDAPSIYTDLAGEGGCRFHQLSTVTFDYDRTRARYAGLGYEVRGEIVSRGQHVAYVDTRPDFGFYTEVVEATPEFLEAAGRISRTCATWDGTDPVRILTRDGYRTPATEGGP